MCTTLFLSTVKSMKNSAKMIIAIVVIVIIVAAIGAYIYLQNAPSNQHTTLTVATTTSLHDTGLEDTGTGNIKEAFEAKYPNITVNFVALGTGDAIKKAQAGDADMILVHSPSQELTFLTDGYGVNRKIVAYNFFVIVGPADDPANIGSITDLNQALNKIYTEAQTNSNIQWVARNDSSGTSTKEQSLWKAAGLDYNQLLSESSWFHATGQGMGATLLIANNGVGAASPAYILSDIGTFLSYSTQGNIPNLKVIIQAQKALLNVYSAIIDDPRNDALSHTNYDASLKFVSYLVSTEGQQLIADYGISTYGQQLFSPFVPLASGTSANATLLGWIQGYAYINSTNQISANGNECPSAFRYNAGDLYSASYDAVATQILAPQLISPNYVAADQPQTQLSSESPNKLNVKNIKI
jgi:tungstate transport system substrate-binding protein